MSRPAEPAWFRRKVQETPAGMGGPAGAGDCPEGAGRRRGDREREVVAMGWLRGKQPVRLATGDIMRPVR